MFKLHRQDVIEYRLPNSSVTYKGTYSVCPDPLCACYNIDVVFDEKDNQQLSNELLLPLNVWHKDISKESKSIFERSYELELAKNIDFDDWQFLSRLYIEKKTELTQQYDIMSLDPTFPIEEIENESILVSFNSILPFATLVTVEIGEFFFIVDDYYCVRQDCSCYNVRLFILPFHEENILQPFSAEDSGEMEIEYDLKINKWTLLRQKRLKATSDEVMSTLSKSLSAIDFYTERRKTIRRLYRNYLHKYSREIPEAKLVTIGRNDPCPCGSGKKYKKCCWRKDI